MISHLILHSLFKLSKSMFECCLYLFILALDRFQLATVVVLKHLYLLLVNSFDSADVLFALELLHFPIEHLPREKSLNFFFYFLDGLRTLIRQHLQLSL